MKANRNLQSLMGASNAHLRAINEASEDSMSSYVDSIDNAVLELEIAAEAVRSVLEEDDGDFVPQSLFRILDRIDADIKDLKKRTAKIG